MLQALEKALKLPFQKQGEKMPRKPNESFMKPMILSAALEAIVGNGPMPRTQVVKKLWVYIKKHKLQDSMNKRNIKPDERLSKVFGSKKPINMFEMTKKVNEHLSF